MKTKIKLIAATGLILATVAVVTASFQWGYSKAETKAAEDHAEALLVYQERLRADHRRAVGILEEDHQRALESAQSHIEVITETKEIIRYVDREITVPAECVDLERHVNRVLIDSTAIIHRASRTGSD